MSGHLTVSQEDFPLAFSPSINPFFQKPLVLAIPELFVGYAM